MEEFNQITLGGMKINRILNIGDEENDVFVYAWRLSPIHSPKLDAIGKLTITRCSENWGFKIENEDIFIPVSFLKDLDKLIDRIKEKYRECEKAS